MKAGIIGTGDVGRALGRGLSGTEHDVLMGSRTPNSTTVDGLRVDSQHVAADFGDVVILALPVDVVTDVAADVKPALVGKPVVDTTNEYPSESPGPSIAERIADVVPEAHIVKGFNTIGANRMAEPVIGDDSATMFLAGDERTAVETVSELAADIGFSPTRAGDLSASAHLEHLARFWIDLSQIHGRDVGFKLLEE